MASGSYNQWDKNQARGCLCDPYFTGPDCSLRKCPVGDDVLTTEVECGGVSNGMQVDEVQKVTVSADRMLGGEMTLTFTDMYGQAWTTRPIAVGGENVYDLYAGPTENSASASCLTYTTPSMYVTDWYKSAQGSGFNTKADWSFAAEGSSSGEVTAPSNWVLGGTANADTARAYSCHLVSSTNAQGIDSAHNARVSTPSDTTTTNGNERSTIEFDDFKNDYRMTMGEIGTLTSASGTLATRGDHSTDIKNALEELPYNVIPSVTVTKDAVSVASPNAAGNKFKQQYSITFDNAANSGDQNMLTCNAEACDEDGCSPRTSGVTHNKFFTKANDLGNQNIKSVDQGSFKIKVSYSTGGHWIRGGVHSLGATGNIVLKAVAASHIAANDYLKVNDEWIQVTGTITADASTETTSGRAKFGTTAAAASAADDIWVQKTVPTSFGTWTVCRPFADGSKSCASFPGSSTAATVQTALRTITGWEGITVSLENELLWVDQTYVVTYAAGYDDEGIIPTVDAYLIASDNTGAQLKSMTVDEHGVASTTLDSAPSGLDHSKADSLTGFVYIGGDGCDALFGDGAGTDNHVGKGVLELYPRALYDSVPGTLEFKFRTSAKPGSPSNCATATIYPIAPYISDVAFSNSIYMAKSLNVITGKTNVFYNKHTHNAGVFPSTKFAIGDKLTVLAQTVSSGPFLHKVFTVKSFKRNSAGVEFAKVWPSPSAGNSVNGWMSELRVSGNNGLQFSRSHESINIYSNEVVHIVLSDDDGAYSTVSQGTWRITVNGATSEILSYAATATEVAAAISKLSTVTGLVTVDRPADATSHGFSGRADRIFKVTFTQSEGDVMHVTAASVTNDVLSDGTNEATIAISKEQDGFAFYDPTTANDKADLLADDVAVGTMFNVSASEVVDFFVVDPDTLGCVGGTTASPSGAAVADTTNVAFASLADGTYFIGDEIIVVSGGSNAGVRAQLGTKAQAHTTSATATNLVACTTATAAHIVGCTGGNCPSLTFSYNGIASETCQVIGNADESTAVAASTDCQTKLRKVPGLSGSSIAIRLTDGITSMGSGAGGVDLISIAVTLPKGVDGSGLTATLSGSILASSQSNPLSGNEYLYRKHWRNNNGRSFTVTKARENRIAAATAVSGAANANGNGFALTVGSDVHAMFVLDDEMVGVHNIPATRISATNSEILSVSGTSDATVFEDQVYTLDGSSDCLLITFEDGSAQGDSAVNKHVRAHRLSGVCADGNVKVLSAGGTDATAGPTALTSGSAAGGGAIRATGASDTFFKSVGSSASSTGNFAFTDSARAADAVTADSTYLAYSNAYYGTGGDMLVVDSKPDAIRGGSAIAMDITYTGPSGSCSVEEVTKGSKESAVCSNRGVCDYETGTCVCAEGFMKEACSEQSVLV